MMEPIPFTAVNLTGRFWTERLDTVLAHTIPSQHKKLAEMTILDSLKIPSPPPPLVIPRHSNGFSVQVFWDSDVGKWIEAASFALSHRRDAKIEAQIEAIVDDLEKAQAPDGYLNGWYQCREPENRWTNLRDNHELYNAGHLLEGAVAYYQATGRRRFLDVMERFLDHIRATFGVEDGKKRGYCGHAEIELALIKHYRATGDKKSLELASYFIDERGQSPNYFDQEAVARGQDPATFVQKTHEYSQSHIPVREQTKVVGHAVRAMYLYSAMADVAAIKGDQDLQEACRRLWDDLMLTKIYITGGLGPSASNEGFTFDYDLPNGTAYAETCAAVALAFWAQRMFNLTGEGRYADVMETALYNGALVGLSRDGTKYFYANPLESNGAPTRWQWHNCPCCTMNVSRLVASISGYFLSANDDTVSVNLYGGFDAKLTVAGVGLALKETSNYPWDGRITLDLEPEMAADFELRLRVPGWAKAVKLSVNGKEHDTTGLIDSGYLRLRRTWKPGDQLQLDLPMPIQKIYAHPEVSADVGRLALTRGPLVYCLEEVDNEERVQRLRIPETVAPKAVESALFDGIVAIEFQGSALKSTDLPLYSTTKPKSEPAVLTAIPYYLWNNRGQGSMSVWIGTE